MWDWTIIDSVAKIKEMICIKMIHLGTGVLGKNIGSMGNGLGKLLLFMFEEEEALSKNGKCGWKKITTMWSEKMWKVEG